MHGGAVGECALSHVPATDRERSFPRMAKTTTEAIPQTLPAGTGEEEAAPARSGSSLVRLVRNRWVRLAALVVLLGLDLVVPVLYARWLSLVLPTLHLDGSFQTASGLFRFESG